MINVFTKLWRGQYSLPAAFLGFFIFGSWGALFVAAMVMLIFSQLSFYAAGFVVAFLILVLYWLVASVGVWRSAGASMASGNWVSKLEAFLARGFVLLIAAYAAWSLYAGGALWLMQRLNT
jgi:hypothetical protein